MKTLMRSVNSPQGVRLLDRRAVPAQYDVLPVIPLPDGEERLVWVTNIFIASDLSEDRVSLADYPATSITYNFSLRCGLANSWLETLPTASNLWMLPYFPYWSQATVANGNLTFHTDVHYPYFSHLLTYRHEELRYYSITAPSGTSSDVVVHGYAEHPSGSVAVCPCFEAILDKSIKYSSQGPNQDGSTVGLTFRMTGVSEQMMNYHVDDFDFVSAAQRPVSVDAMRRQVTYAPAPAPAHTYSPIAYKENQVPKTSTSYFLDSYQADADYYYRGALMKRLGALTADHYLTADKLHRLQDDSVTIKHTPRLAKASVTLREVSA